MKNKLSILCLVLAAAWLSLSLACGSAQNQNGGNLVKSVNAAATENTNVAQTSDSSNSNSPTEAANKLAVQANKIDLPPANPIENGKPQVFYSNTVFFTIPKDWKKRRDSGIDVLYESPDAKLGLNLYVLNQEKTGTMMEEYEHITETYKDDKVTLMNIGEAVGILRISAEKPDDKIGSIYWESYPPPDSKGNSLVLDISVHYPVGEFEQHKQLISDILHEIRIKK